MFDQGETLSLSPLRNLANLKVLQLSGDECECTIDGLPQHLTELSLSLCVVRIRQACACVSSLHRIELFESMLCGTHPNRLLACLGLQQLDCSAGCIMASTADNTLDGHAHRVCAMPASLSVLTSLTNLCLSMSSQDPELDVQCLYVLEGLKHLELGCASSMCITPFLSGLQRLTYLRLPYGFQCSSDFTYPRGRPE